MSESILFEILKKSKENKEIIGIWKYNDDDGFWAGYVNDYNEELVTIQHFTKYGKSDGIIIERIENIKSVLNAVKYLKNCEIKGDIVCQ